MSRTHLSSPAESQVSPHSDYRVDHPAQRAKLIWLSIALAAIAASLTQIGWGQPIVNGAGLSLLREFFAASLHPDLSPEFLQTILGATVTTLAYALCGTFLSVLLGLVGGLFSSELWWQALLLGSAQSTSRFATLCWRLIRGLLAIPRAIHELIWGLFFVQIFGLDPLVALCAIAVPFGAICAKIFAEIIDETPRQPFLSLVNSGATPLAAFLYGLVPQALPNLLSYCFYRFECSIRSAAVLGIIGAGGLGYEIFLSLQSLRYEQLWTGFYALIALTALADGWSATLRKRMGFTSRLDLNQRSKSSPKSSRKPFQNPSRSQPSSQSEPTWAVATPQPKTDWFVRGSIMGIAIAIPACFAYLQIEWTRLVSPRTVQQLVEIIQAAFPPQLDGSWTGLLQLSAQTLAMSILAITLAGVGGILLSFPAANTILLKSSWLAPTEGPAPYPVVGRVIWLASRVILLVARGIPAPIWALVCLFVLFPGILPGAIALGLHNLGILGRLMAEVNENADEAPARALRALGASGSAVVLYSLLPQNLPRFLAYILYRWEVCIRATVIVGLVGAGGLGRLLTEQISSFDYAGVVTTLGVFIVLTFAVDWVSTSARRVLR
ncbi:MAG: PhnE/PtxC family ABC transporter permease [Thainema sp.]